MPEKTLSGDTEQKTMRLLIIEDEADLLSSLAKALREEGYAIDTATDGQDGLFMAMNA